MTKRQWLTRLGVMGLAACLPAWDAPGHRTITQVALDLLPTGTPQWLRDDDARARIIFQSNEPDRWRGVHLEALSHENAPDHYMDLEDLDKHKLTLKTLPRLRYEFVAQLARTTEAKPHEPQGVQRSFTDEVGFLPYAIAEHYAKLVSSFNTLRILEQLDESQRTVQVQATRSNVVAEMGQLSHFVGDAAQPLHTTIHHHGWVGQNPKGYTTDKSFHSYIDGEVVQLHALNARGLEKDRLKMRAIEPHKVWEETIGLIERSHAQVEPLYELQRSGELQKEAGAKMIAARMEDAAGVLAGLYWAAWEESKPTARQVEDFKHFDAFGVEDQWPTGPTEPPGPKR